MIGGGKAAFEGMLFSELLEVGYFDFSPFKYGFGGCGLFIVGMNG